MKVGSCSWRALMWRNLIYRKRNLIGTFFEIFLPIALVGILIAIRNQAEKVTTVGPYPVSAFVPQNDDAFVPMSFGDYLTAIQARRVCYAIQEGVTNEFGQQVFGITGIPTNSYNWQVPFVKCDARSCKYHGEDASRQYCEYNILALAPYNEGDDGGYKRAEDFANYIVKRYPMLSGKNSSMPFDYPLVQIFRSVKHIDDYVKWYGYGDVYHPKIAMGVIFLGNSANRYDYALRMNSTNYYPGMGAMTATRTTPDTQRLFDSFAHWDDVCTPAEGKSVPNLGPEPNSCTRQYVYNGALTIQRLVNDFILEDSGAKAKGSYVAEHGVAYVPFPADSYVTNGFYKQINAFAPLLLTLGLLFPAAVIIRSIVREKELRQKELMKMMSVTESNIQWSWFMSFFLFHFVTACFTAIVASRLYLSSDFGFLWMFWILTFLAIICFCMALSTFMSNATRATLVGLLLFFAGYFLTLAVKYDSGSLGLINLISLHPIAAFSYGLQQIGDWEDKLYGVTSDTWNIRSNPSNYTFQKCLGMLLLDCVLWGVVSWYLNRVIPGEFGQSLRWYFPFTKSYWRPNSVKLANMDFIDEGESLNDNSIPTEPVTDALKSQSREGKSIEIRGLSKRFGDKTAVDSLNLSMYNGQITGLLGHNGAGKTTTINMLTGILAPTDGYATVSGKDIRTQMPQIRQEIGVCLQHDCLFPQLTVLEHVQFFARIKGLYDRVNFTEAEGKVAASLQDVGLSEKSLCLSKNLSGGMKRKLSVAIAFCGDSKTVLLDEPTSGMDPFSRRFTWNVIRRYRQGRTIILTTHFMDEADLLSDRIAIMAEGSLRCVGSSLFLKKAYGVGYQLTIEKAVAPALSSNEQDVVDFETGAIVKNVLPTESVDDTIRAIVIGAVREAQILSNVGTEMTFRLPLEAASDFTPIFEALDREMVGGAVKTYGISLTTLDEVFLLVARGVDPTAKKGPIAPPVLGAWDGDQDKDSRSVTSNDWLKMDLEAKSLFSVHMRALFKKRAINFKRDKKAWCCTTILPTLFVFIGFLVFASLSPIRDLDPLMLELSQYNRHALNGPQNPFLYNPNGTQFTCQPGVASYMVSPYETNWTGESYQYCGDQTRLNGSYSQTCSISKSSAVLSRVYEAATPIPANASDVASASEAVFRAQDTAFAASQYASVYFSHDPTSVTSDGKNYSEEVVKQCLAHSGQYLPKSECNNYGGFGYVIGYNFSALHVAPLYQSLVDEAIAKQALNDRGFTITTRIHPLPITEIERESARSQDAFTAWFLLVLSFPFIAGSFATFVVTERESKAKHLQTVAGVNPVAYWVSTYLWDVMNYQIPLWITIILMFSFDVTTFTTTMRGVVGGVILSLALYGPATAGFSYCVSFLFKSPSLCNLFVIIFCFLVGMGGPLAQFITRMLGANPSNTNYHLVDVANSIETWLRFIPSFCLGNALFKIINIEAYEWLNVYPITVWNSSLLRYEVLFLFWQSFGYLGLAILLDILSNNPRAVSLWRKFVRVVTCCWWRTGPRDDATLAVPYDDDVVQEQQRVLSGDASDDLITITQLTKMYDNGKLAVNNLSLGIPPGECFGLLGVNGAGKTTTISMLTAEFPPTSGDATLAGHSVRNEPGKTRRRVGYCPQFDAHFQNLTGLEHVLLYASVKGIAPQFVKDAAAAKLDEVGIDQVDRNKLTSQYSGGMRRRLSLACATIGQPQILFLDECSTGVDPVARREIWEMISRMVNGRDVPANERTSVILTTHSMEECEALCPRIGIMANGRLQCLGSAQHLKSKFGKGYQVEFKVKTVDREEEDYKFVVAQLYQAVRKADDESDSLNVLFLAHSALQSLTGDDYLVSMLAGSEAQGQVTFRNPDLPYGIDLDELASFATVELRIRNVHNYITETFRGTLLRERQDNLVRYEVKNDYRLADIFSGIEENKERLMVADYGVGQTSLEQVFNRKVAEADKRNTLTCQYHDLA